MLNRHSVAVTKVGTAVSAPTLGIKLKLKLDNGHVLAVPGSTIFWHGLGRCLLEIVISATARPLVDIARAGSRAARAKDATNTTSAISVAIKRRSRMGDTIDPPFESCAQRISILGLCLSVPISASDFFVITNAAGSFPIGFGGQADSNARIGYIIISVCSSGVASICQRT